MNTLFTAASDMVIIFSVCELVNLVILFFFSAVKLITHGFHTIVGWFVLCIECVILY